MIIDAQTPFSFGDPSQGCFYCGQPVSQPWIEWHGQNRNQKTFEIIQLHPGCAVELTIRLLRDVHEYECRHHKSELLTPPAVKSA